MIGGDFSPNLDPISDKKKIYEKKNNISMFLYFQFISQIYYLVYKNTLPRRYINKKNLKDAFLGQKKTTNHLTKDEKRARGKQGTMW